LIWLTVNKVCSTKVLLVITRSEKIMLVSNEVAFSLIFLIPNIYRTRGKAGDDKVYGDLVKTQMEDKKSSSTPVCMMPTR